MSPPRPSSLRKPAKPQRENKTTLLKELATHVGEVYRYIKVVVEEGVVLAGVQHLQEGRRRVAVVRPCEFVDLVDENDGVIGAGDLEALDQLARHGSHVRSPASQDNDVRKKGKRRRRRQRRR